MNIRASITKLSTFLPSASTVKLSITSGFAGGAVQAFFAYTSFAINSVPGYKFKSPNELMQAEFIGGAVVSAALAPVMDKLLVGGLRTKAFTKTIFLMGLMKAGYILQDMIGAKTYLSFTTPEAENNPYSDLPNTLQLLISVLEKFGYIAPKNAEQDYTPTASPVFLTALAVTASVLMIMEMRAQKPSKKAKSHRANTHSNDDMALIVMQHSNNKKKTRSNSVPQTQLVRNLLQHLQSNKINVDLSTQSLHLAKNTIAQNLANIYSQNVVAIKRVKQTANTSQLLLLPSNQNINSIQSVAINPLSLVTASDEIKSSSISSPAPIESKYDVEKVESIMPLLIYPAIKVESEVALPKENSHLVRNIALVSASVGLVAAIITSIFFPPALIFTAALLHISLSSLAGTLGAGTLVGLAGLVAGAVVGTVTAAIYKASKNLHQKDEPLLIIQNIGIESKIAESPTLLSTHANLQRQHGLKFSVPDEKIVEENNTISNNLQTITITNDADLSEEKSSIHSKQLNLSPSR